MAQQQNVSTDNQQILDNIKSLQNSEQDLFNEIEKNIANNTLTTDLRQKLTDQIGKLTEMRVNLYSFLNNASQSTVNHLSSSSVLSTHQGQTIIIVENELNQTKKRLEDLNNIKSNNLRMVEINKYYGDKYQDQSYLMMIIIIICIVLIIIKILHNKNILSDGLYVILLIAALSTGFIVLFWKMVYLYSHDNFDYNKYNWAFNSETAPKIDTDNMNYNNPWKLPVVPDSGICKNVTSYCGSGTMYDSNKNICVALPSSATTSTNPAPINVDDYLPKNP
uniref:Uncharacterized protein n=1 Tax=viral metagenome TaxID=1070528 RepID=A0A6C0DEI1_9ZZZZ